MTIKKWWNSQKQEDLEKVSRDKFFGGIPRYHSTKPLIGWRTWEIQCFTNTGELDLSVANWRLRSVSAQVVWNSPFMTTIVDEDGKLSPVALNNKYKFSSERGDYGVYCYKSVRNLVFYHNLCSVSGWGELSGHVIEHEYGYRAQKFVIRELWAHEIYKKVFEEIYQCPVHASSTHGKTEQLMLIREQELIWEQERDNG